MFFEVKNLNFAYLKSPLCLKDINFSFAKNDNVLILASKEQGKTTFLKVLSTFEDKYFGWIKLEGQDLKKLKDEDKNFSLLLAEPVFLENKTIKENIDFLCETSKISKLFDDELNSLLKEFLIDADITTKVKKLSLENKLKLQMMRTFIKKPRIVFIDDQFEKLDDEHSSEIFDIFVTKILTLDATKVFAIGDISYKKLKSQIKRINLSKVLYLNLAELQEFKNLSEFEKSYSKLDIINFLNEHTICDVSLICDKDCYFVELDENKSFRLDKKFEQNLKKLKLEFADLEPCKIVSKNELNLENMSDADFNETLAKNEVYLFSVLDGLRVI